MDSKTENDIQFRSAMDTAVRLLTTRGHTAQELAMKLKKRRIKPAVVEQVAAECKRLHYIDDENTARHYTEELKRKGYGRRHVRMAMQKKGLPADTIEITLEALYSASEEEAIAERMMSKKKRSFEREKDMRKKKSRAYRYLYSRGFSPDAIAPVLNSLET